MTAESDPLGCCAQADDNCYQDSACTEDNGLNRDEPPSTWFSGCTTCADVLSVGQTHTVTDSTGNTSDVQVPDYNTCMYNSVCYGRYSCFHALHPDIFSYQQIEPSEPAFQPAAEPAFQPAAEPSVTRPQVDLALDSCTDQTRLLHANADALLQIVDRVQAIESELDALEADSQALSQTLTALEEVALNGPETPCVLVGGSTTPAEWLDGGTAEDMVSKIIYQVVDTSNFAFPASGSENDQAIVDFVPYRS
eukprot:SAG31_NODE_2879_length_4960_cov_13.684839_4_plen_251_part_00